MKLKGISFWEQNVEKIFLGVVGVGVLGALGYQYVLQNTAVQVGKDTVPPEKSLEPVAKAARELKGKLEATNPKLPEIPQVNLADKFTQMVAGGVTPIKEFPAFGRVARIKTDGVIESKGDRLFAEVAIPAPGNVIAHAFRSTVSPFELARHPEVKDVLPAEQPFDKASASVEASFDGAALKAAFQADPDGNGPVEALLPSWWRDTEIIGIEMERQLEGSDGSWGEPTPVAAMPGRVDLLGEVKKKVKTTADLPVILAVARSAPDEVQRPPYYSTIAGVDWKPPAELAEAGPAAEAPKDERGRLVARITDLENRARKVQDQIAQQAAQKAKQPAQPAGGGGGGGGKLAGGGRGQEGGQPTSTGPTETPAEKALKTLALQLDRARQDLQKYDQKAGTTQTPGATAPGATQPKLGPDGKPLALPLLENPKVNVWAHDVTVEAGKSYRYRVRIAVTNPLFGRQASLKPEQAKLAQEAVLRSEWSEWSDRVTVDPSEYYFITSANERDVTGPTRASAELFKFYYGYYRRGSVTVEPGDVLAADMKLPDGLKIYDVTKLALLTPQANQPTPEAPTTRDENGEGRGRRVLRANSPQVDDRGNREAQPAAQQPTTPVAANQPPADGSWKPAPKTMRMAVDAMLLDVGPVALVQENRLGGKGELKTQAFLRITDGEIEVRLPTGDRSDPAYQRLRKNAEAGEQASKPKEPENPGGPLNLPPPPTAPKPGAQPPGGGGGGG